MYQLADWCLGPTTHKSTIKLTPNHKPTPTKYLDPTTGKTLQSIAFLAYLKDVLGVSGPHLVVVPLSVLPNWMSEIERFCPSMRCIRFHGPKQERARIKAEELCDVREFDLVVTTYEMLTSEVNFFKRRFFWRVVIVDEGHRLKNEKSQLSENLRKVRFCMYACMYGLVHICPRSTP